MSNMAYLNESFTALRAQITPQHRSNMTSRNEIRNQISTLQHEIQNKVIKQLSNNASPLTTTFPRKGPFRFPEKLKNLQQSRMWTHVSGKLAPLRSQYALRNILLEILKCRCRLVS